MDNRSFLRRLPGKIITPINIKTGRAIYKNGANFTDNLNGKLRLKKARRLFDQTSNDNLNASEDNKKMLDELSSFASTIYTPSFDSEDIDNICKEYHAVIDNPEHSCFVDEFGRRGEEKSSKIYLYDLINPTKSVSSIKKLFTDEFQDFLRSHFKSEFKVEWVNMRRTIHIPQSKLEENYPHQPYSLKWHFDGHSVDTLKFFVNLSDVTENDGPLHFLDKQRSYDICKQGYYNRFNYGVEQDVIEDNKYLKKLTGKIGSAAFCNTTLCLHRAGVPAKGRTRDILEFNFSPAEKKFDVSDLDSYTPPTLPYA